MARVGQIVPNLGFHDAIAREALLIDRQLRAAGHATALFAARHHPRAAAQCRPLAAYRPGDWEAVILHHSTLSGGAELLRGTRGILLYHNITPPRYFHGVNPELVAASARGLAQLAELLPAAAAVWADSAFNLAELRAHGVTGGTVVPYLLADDHLRTAAPAPAAAGEPCILAVGRIVPNKGYDLLLRALAELAVPARLVIVGSDAGAAAYRRRLQDLAVALGVAARVTWAGECEDAELADWYARARVLAVASEHEGFCVPLVEAMRAGVPVVAMAQPAVEETLGGSGCVVTRRTPALFAAALRAVLTDAALRTALLAAQRRRADDFALARTGTIMVAALAAVLADGAARPAAALRPAPPPPALRR
ncbi:MAG TPA: glycosyltransferase, partial [bacterium]|nr:glycosyltransferase [bacterium]